MTCTGAVRSNAATLDDVIAEIAATRVTERGETRADDRVVRGRDGGPQARGLLLVATRRPRARRGAGAAAAALRHRRLGRRRQVDADRAAALRREVAARPTRSPTASSTSRGSPTACAPSASRASRSTSPTATSRRRGGGSSSPTPRATRSTRATWSPAPRPPTSRSCSSTRARACSPRAAATRRSPGCSASRGSCWPSTRWTSSTTTPTPSARSAPTSAPGPRGWRSRRSPASRSRALKGDNVVERSEAMDWYRGPTLLEFLESGAGGGRVADGPLRLPVQYVIRAGEQRAYAGQLAGGTCAWATRSSCCRAA